MQAAGYEADTLALAPADDETLDLYALTQLNSTGVDPWFGLRRRVTKGTPTAPLVEPVPCVFDLRLRSRGRGDL